MEDEGRDVLTATLKSWFDSDTDGVKNVSQEGSNGCSQQNASQPLSPPPGIPAQAHTPRDPVHAGAAVPRPFSGGAPFGAGSSLDSGAPFGPGAFSVEGSESHRFRHPTPQHSVEQQGRFPGGHQHEAAAVDVLRRENASLLQRCDALDAAQRAAVQECRKKEELVAQLKRTFETREARVQEEMNFHVEQAVKLAKQQMFLQQTQAEKEEKERNAANFAVLAKQKSALEQQLKAQREACVRAEEREKTLKKQTEAREKMPMKQAGEREMVLMKRTEEIEQTLRSEKASLQAELSSSAALRTELSTAKQRCVVLTQDKEALEKELSALRMNLERLRWEKAKGEADHQKLEKELSALRMNLERLRGEKAKGEADHQKLEKEVSALRMNLERLKGEKAKGEAERVVLTQDKEALEKEVSALKMKLEHVEGEQAKGLADYQKLVEQTAKKQLETIKKFEVVVQEKKENANMLSCLREEKECMKKQLQSMQEEISQIKKGWKETETFRKVQKQEVDKMMQHAVERHREIVKEKEAAEQELSSIAKKHDLLKGLYQTLLQVSIDSLLQLETPPPEPEEGKSEPPSEPASAVAAAAAEAPREPPSENPVQRPNAAKSIRENAIARIRAVAQKYFLSVEAAPPTVDEMLSLTAALSDPPSPSPPIPGVPPVESSDINVLVEKSQPEPTVAEPSEVPASSEGAVAQAAQAASSQRRNETERPSMGVLLRPSLRGTESMRSAVGAKGRKEAEWKDLRCVQEVKGSESESAVTCLCFGQERHHLHYYLMACASKDGNIVIYRIYRTEMERAQMSKDELDQIQSAAPGASGTRSEWDSPPSSDNDLVFVHHRLTGHSRAVTSIFFSPTEDQLVTTSIDKCARLWNVDSGELMKTFTDSSANLGAAFLPSNPKVLVAANSNAVVRLLNADNGIVHQKLKVDSEVRAMRFDGTGKYLMAGTKAGNIHVLEAIDGATLKFKFRLTVARGVITCITFVPSPEEGRNPFVLVNSCDDIVSIVDCLYGPAPGVLCRLQVQHRVKVANALLPVRCCYSSFGGGYLISGSEDKEVYVFALRKEMHYKSGSLAHHRAPVLSVATNRTDTLLVSADSQGSIALWRRHDCSQLP
uniref:Uncharacterized protein n=1 Tax=Chromera velia CCMP2878 TaxID=1169474 RepID=A0A0G4GQT3_9ALVE|eukprot:Cvel_22961.t1-p1 / transcript=Cvel_22961.t1 / gene=Cvel_22961 / organism=Chromera_velia_CCMP2878 / gene_product=WD repeat-containing protein 13, putative / transcript_product=WD repeat-containing protein 13, putative / location=Cvel_scaffold2313:25752-29916(-) / protein_length=1110 / sequence_SO=supercontig / SO=protein_coding / is_pseudo=false